MILRFCICIPTYNNPATILAVVRDCLVRTPYPVLVVDDGSIPAVSLAGIEDPDSRLTVIRFESNQGKGMALQAGMRECLKRGFTHLISVDGDGQHLASEISKLTAVALAEPWDLVIGNRRLVSGNVPGLSKFGRKFSNFWVRFQTSHPILDSQSGFRIYPLSVTQNLTFWTKKFDFEIEVLIRCLWRGVNVREVEIECYYPAPEERVSHFHKFRDNARLSCLNTVLVVLSLLRANDSPRKIALAVGTGVWIGSTPFFGLHALIAAAFSFLFRLNAVYLLLGTQISIPPIAPILAIASIFVGGFLTGTAATGSRSFSWNWLLGSCVVGAGLGLLFGVLSYFIAKRIQAKGPAQKAAWNGRARGGRFGNWFLKTVIQYAGLESAYAFLVLIVPYFYLSAPRARRSMDEYWRTTRPELGWLRRQLQIQRLFFRYAQTLLDRVYQGFQKEPCFAIKTEGRENILGAIESGQGLILMTAHVGGWDLAATALHPRDASKRLNMVQYESRGMTFDKVRDQDDPAHMNRLMANQAEQPVLKIKELLEQGNLVALMGDRPLGNQFELVLFFGKLAPIDCTAFRIAAACQVPLLFTFGFKGRGRQYDFYATEARRYRYETGADRSLQIQAWAQDYARVLESFVRKYPEQWFNFFPFWSASPKPPEGVEVSRARNYSREELHRPGVGKPVSVTDPRSNAETMSRM
jgi:predicted LPLAT superfamily acyltransferase/glycosyltransferase involved in cell wall biosynthesis